MAKQLKKKKYVNKNSDNFDVNGKASDVRLRSAGIEAISSIRPCKEIL